MGLFKNYVTCIVAFFIPFTCATLCEFYSIASPVLFTKNNKLWDERKQIFLYIWLLQRITLYQRRQRITSLDSNFFEQILYKYLRYTNKPFEGVLWTELHQKPRRKDWVTEKSTKKNLCEGHQFFGCTPSFLCHFLSPFLSAPSPFPSDVLVEWSL